MEKKKLNFATIEAAIKNEAIEINEKDEEEIFALIIIDRINHKKKPSGHHTFLYGNSNEIAASIAMRMLKVEEFRDMIYKAVISYEITTEARIEKPFSVIDNILGKIIDNFEGILKKKRMDKQ